MNSRTSITVIALSLFAGAAGAQSTQAVEWKVSEGGNGHWYQVHATARSWSQARQFAYERGGHLVTESNAAEKDFVWSIASPVVSPQAFWIGAFQPDGSCEPGCGWRWVTEELFVYGNWRSGEPNNNTVNGNEDCICTDWSNGWNDLAGTAAIPFVLEWDADCNSDGIVDYGQILSGELQDDNQNNVPDICEYTVTGVIPVSGPSSGGTSIILNGTNFPENPSVLVGGSPATNVLRVSATRLTAVTPAGLPGMTSVTVGNWVQPNAFYYRPECGSDLDQDGEVTAADIAIVLLDFGPCYVTVTSPQPDDSKPFMLQDQPAPEAPRSR